MNSFAPYRAATGCTRYGPEGPQALITYTEDVFGDLHRNLGICNCRPIRGAASWSHHAECRAADDGFTITRDHPWGYRFALLLARHGKRLGIDHIITNARPWESGRGRPLVYSARSPNGRTYTGAHPHKDHNHTGLTRSAAGNLTYATLVAVLGPPATVAAQLALTTTTPPTGDDEMSLKRGDKGNAVTKFQTALMAERKGALPEWGADGDFGAETEAAVKDYQRRADLPQTGVIDGVVASLLLEYVADRVGGTSGLTETRAAQIADGRIAQHAQDPDAHHE